LTVLNFCGCSDPFCGISRGKGAADPAHLLLYNKAGIWQRIRGFCLGTLEEYGH